MSYDDVKVELKGINTQIDDVELEPNPAYGEMSLPKAPSEPQPYEVCVGVTSNDVAIEENPAYQPGEPQPYEECVEGVTSSDDVAMEGNPSYQSADTVTASQTGEPVYL